MPASLKLGWLSMTSLVAHDTLRHRCRGLVILHGVSSNTATFNLEMFL